MKKPATKILALCALGAFGVQADTGKLEMLDLDQNDSISLEEAMPDAALSSLFIDLDINQDGMVNRLELSRFEAVARAREKAIEPACTIR